MPDVAFSSQHGAAVTFVALPGSREWMEAWRVLRFALYQCGLGVGNDVAQEQDGEVWQYLCSERPPGKDYLVHEFRHRFHPLTMGREYLKVVTTAP